MLSRSNKNCCWETSMALNTILATELQEKDGGTNECESLRAFPQKLTHF
jgi:hypothetical protein